MFHFFGLNKSKGTGFVYLTIAVLLLAGLIYSMNLFAYRSGITGQTSSGCTCHGTQNSNTTLTAISQSGSWSVQTGSTNTFTVRVANSGYSYAGVNIAVKTTQNGETNVGTLTPNTGSGLQSSNGELTHTSPKNYSSYASFDFTWTAPSTPGTYYLRAAGNAVNNNNQNTGDQWNFMTTQEITVVAPTQVAVTSPNGGETVCPGATFNITWTSSNVTNVKILLSSDGGNNFTTTLVASTPASTGSWTWNVPSNLTAGNTYRVRIEDASNSSVKDESDANFTVGSPTTITQHPQSQRVCAGTQVQFTVSATGNNLTYRWRRNGQDVAGGNSATLTINPVSVLSAGNYDCVVSGACGSPQTSNVAILTVDTLPRVTTQPQSQSICETKTVTFSVVAVGTDLTYQWRKNNMNIPNANTSSLTLQNVTPNDEGQYDVVVTGRCSPSATSEKATLTVLRNPNILVQPKPVTACEGGKAFIFVQAEGSSLVYTWVKNGTEIPNSNNDTLFFDNLQSSDSGFYLVRIQGVCENQVESQAIKLSVNPKPIITKHPENQNLTVGSTLTLVVEAKGSNLSYQWKKNGKNLPGKTQPTLVISNVQMSDAGMYLCEVTNNCGTSVSNSSMVSVTTSGSNAKLQYSVDTLDLGTSVVGRTLETLYNALLKNVGTENLVINSFSFAGPNASEFDIEATFPITLSPNETADLKLKFTPNSEGFKLALLNFQSNSSVSMPLVVVGNATKTSILLSLEKITFTSPSPGEAIIKNLVLTNLTSTQLNLSLEITGANADAFQLLTEKNVTLLAGDSVNVSIQFSSQETTRKTAQLIINVAETTEQFTIELEGEYASSVDDEVSTLAIYPNPASQQIIFAPKTLATNYHIKIYSQQGFLVNKFTLDNQTHFVWDLRDTFGNTIPNGVYNCVVSNGVEFKVFKLLIIR
jgi:hypothetical protein